MDAGKRLREAEEAVLAGKEDRDQLKAAAGEERDSIVRLVGFARKIAESSERKVAPAAFDRVAETLQAASADSELAERVRAGRLDKEARAATVGLTAPPAPASRRRKGGGRAAEQRAERERTRAELDRARRDLERAEARRERAQVEADKQSGRLKQARAELAEAKREAKRLADEVRRAEAAVSKR